MRNSAHWIGVGLFQLLTVTSLVFATSTSQVNQTLAAFIDRPMTLALQLPAGAPMPSAFFSAPPIAPLSPTDWVLLGTPLIIGSFLFWRYKSLR